MSMHPQALQALQFIRRLREGTEKRVLAPGTASLPVEIQLLEYRVGVRAIADLNRIEEEMRRIFANESEEDTLEPMAEDDDAER